MSGGKEITTVESRLKQLHPQHYRAIALRLQGADVSTIAKELNVTEGTVYAWFRQPLIKKELEEQSLEIIEGVKAQLLSGAEDAVKTIKRIARSPKMNPTVLNAARDVLDRIGVKQGQRIEITGRGGGPIQVAHYSVSEQKQILEEALEALNTVDAEYEVISNE